MRLAVHTVDFVVTTKGKEGPIALDVVLTRVILSGVIANSTLVPKATKLNTVDSAKNSHVTYLSTNLIQNMDIEVHSQGLGSWHTERRLEQKNTMKWLRS